MIEEIKNFYKDKSILVTGGVGSIGSILVETLLKYNPKVVRIFDINESRIFEFEQQLKSKKIRALIGDIRDKERLKRAIEDIDVVFHAAALKHVPLCEYNPFEAVKTNIVGTQNLIDVALDEEIEKFILISTDKAVNPNSVMGASKLLSERLTISSNFYKGKRKTSFSCVRFGNVLGSRGSVVPLFERQIKDEKRITLTDPNMTRFVMSISHSVELVVKASYMARGGEIFVLKMPSISMKHLADFMIEKLALKYDYNVDDIKIDIIGKRLGEKNFEELMTKDESINTYEDEEMFIILPQNTKLLLGFPYSYLKRFRKTKKDSYKSNEKNLLKNSMIKKLLD